MSVTSYLVCPSRQLALGLGKRLRNSDGDLTGFALNDRLTSDDVDMTQALWKFLVDTAGEELVVKFSDAADYEEIASHREISLWADEDRDVSIADYLRDGAQP
ncbi:hypothetical protein [Actinoplanes utahensis]|uniref:Uncharacterized protein n=1 Tax=Actinoplanes utahensis TaxID=1869 RepID=A0A0A6USV0_ACTUT|nr:hypothetical protein [Actinoplanes utahensis]KHD78501.1 hypothetical protein MB27_04625 [Actinoplanes utahensis]GIF31831.1 hypothetical protein Aut01nite_48170 [Actinoplanes utahensis]